MKCADDDECSALGEAACSGGRCVNTHGSFTCECGPGSVLDSTGEAMWPPQNARLLDALC